MRTDIAVEKLCDITPIIADVASDLKNNEEIKNFILAYKADTSNKIFAVKIFPLLMKNYKKEIFEVLAVLNGVSVETVMQQDFTKTLGAIKDLIADEDIRSFFSWFFVKKKEEKPQAE